MGNRSPLQLWHSGLRHTLTSNLLAVTSVLNGTNIEEYGIDDAGIFPEYFPNNVQVPDIEPVNPAMQQDLQLVPDPLLDDGDNGCHHYKYILGML